MSDRSKGFNPAVLSGGALILVGVLLLLDQMGLISFDFWAVVIGAFGLLRFIQASNPTGRLWGLLLMAVGAAIELAPLGFVKIHLEETWPVFVIAAGVILIWRATSNHRRLEVLYLPTLTCSQFWEVENTAYELRISGVAIWWHSCAGLTSTSRMRISKTARRLSP
jgi:hypothetical protein